MMRYYSRARVQVEMNSALISIPEQLLSVFNERQELLFQCRVNTAQNGVGCVRDSGCTPFGKHYVRACIGKGLSPYAVLKGRRATGEEWTPALRKANPERDWILGRILWLCGQEIGLNRGGQVDTFRRYIYIHGSPAWTGNAPPASHGCVRVSPEDMLLVFDYLGFGSLVSIQV